LTIPLPFVAGTAEGVAEPKIPNMRGIMSARTKPLNVVEAIEVKTNLEVISFETPAPRGQVKLVPADNVSELVELLHTEAKII
jgi:electron transfer flavoprotein beta subunit